MAFLGATLMPGIEIVMKAVSLPERLRKTHLVLTGEGKIDAQTAFGKTLSGIAQTAKANSLPVVAIAGGIGDDVEPVYSCGIDAVYPLTPYPISLPDAMQRSEELLVLATERALRLVGVGQQLNILGD